MNPKDLKFFRFYPVQWMAGAIQEHDGETIKFFINLLCTYWAKDGVLTEASLRKSYKKRGREIDELIDTDIIKIDGKYIKIEFLDEQFQEIKAISEQATAAVNKRWSKYKNNANTDESKNDADEYNSNTPVCDRNTPVIRPKYNTTTTTTTTTNTIIKTKNKNKNNNIINNKYYSVREFETPTGKIYLNNSRLNFLREEISRLMDMPNGSGYKNETIALKLKALFEVFGDVKDEEIFTAIKNVKKAVLAGNFKKQYFRISTVLNPEKFDDYLNMNSANFKKQLKNENHEDRYTHDENLEDKK